MRPWEVAAFRPIQWLRNQSIELSTQLICVKCFSFAHIRTHARTHARTHTHTHTHTHTRARARVQAVNEWNRLTGDCVGASSVNV